MVKVFAQLPALVYHVDSICDQFIRQGMLVTVQLVSSLLQLQWKQDLDLGLELISKAIEIDSKCDFAYETMGTIEVQRCDLKIVTKPNIFILLLKVLYMTRVLSLQGKSGQGDRNVQQSHQPGQV